MAYVFAQNPTVANGTGSSISKAFVSNVTAHSLMVALVTAESGATSGTFAFSGGGSWVTLQGVINPASTQWVVIGYCLDATGGATTVQATWTGPSSFNGLNIAEFTNSGVASLLDTNTPGRINASSSTATDAAMTTTAAGVAVSFVNSSSGVTATSAGGGFTLWTSPDSPDLCYGEYQITAGAGTLTPTFNLSGSIQTGIVSAAFKPAAAAAAPIPNVTMAPMR
jgi:hypothetical protein